MKMSKKILKILMIFTFVLTFIFVNIRTKVNAYTLNIEEDEQELFIEETIKIFGNVEINSIEYLYNFNDSPDYVYVDFEGLGYVIYYRTTLEMMEYSYEFDLDYSNIDSRKYYAGPSNYYGKKDNKFIDVDTGDYLNLSDSDIELYANNLSTFFSVDADERLNYFLNLNVDIDNSSITTSQNNNAPEFDSNAFITPNAPGAVNTKYINNYDYFLSNPRHGFNEHGTCGSVAAQILLGYNNYYNDRRIIDVEHLYGDWSGSANSNLYDKSNYVYPERNMNVCNNPMSLTRYTTGTNNDFYEFVIQNIEPTGLNCTCTSTSIVVSGSTATVTTTIYFPDGTTSTSVTTRDANPGEQSSSNTEHTHTGSSTDDVVEGLVNILSAKFDDSQYSITHDEKGWFFGWSPISSTPIKAEIDSGRPLIIGLDSDLGGTDHWVVGYGYQDYNYPGDSETYSGYIVHFGWTNRYNVWINESWCDSYIALQMNHTHNLNIQTNNIIDDTKIELRCGECGYRTLDDLYTVSDNTLVSVNYEISGDIEIPENINGTQILSIGNNAFSNQNNLLSVTIPNTITNIDSYAFEGCTNLESVTLSNSLYAIGVGAFKGCSSLEEIEIPASVQHIDSNAFENCTSLTSVIVERAVTGITNLGSNVFDGCSTSLQIVVPQDRVAEYKNKVYWSSYRSKIIPDNASYSEIDLYCLIDEDESVTLNAGYNKLYKLVVECTRSYKFITNASSKIIVYNSDMTVAYSGNNSLTAYLNKGTHYLSIEHSTLTTSGTIKINYELAYNPDGIAIAYNSSNGTNIASGLHLTENNVYHCRLKYTNYNGAGFYKFTLNAGPNATYPENAIQVYTDANRTNLLSMYSLSELDIYAQSNENENIMYIYLPENGTYYIDVTLPLSSYSTLTFNIQSAEVNNINYLDSLSSIGFDVLFENVNTQSCFEEVTISHRSEIQLDVLTNGTINNNIKVYVFEKVRDPGYEPGINYYYIESVYIDEITSINRSPVFTLILDPGTYYFGYAENENNVNINYALRRMVDYDININDTLVADPSEVGYDVGTEVRFNDGVCDNYTITEGFTRNIYLMVEDRLRDHMSRLDYDWYSSNENVAIVSQYGTVLAKPVDSNTTVTIYAVLKEDPSVVYRTTFTILNDTSEELIEIECNMSYSFSEENGYYNFELNDSNSPYPMIQYYDWSIFVPCQENDISVTMGAWGYITASGPGIAIITGTYELNPRVTIIINLTITE